MKNLLFLWLFFVFGLFVSGPALAQTTAEGADPLSGEAPGSSQTQVVSPEFLDPVATQRLAILESLGLQVATDSSLQEKLVGMALWDPVVPVRLQAEKALNRIQPLNQQEQELQFQLSSIFPNERREAIIALKKSPLPFKPALQYAILKNMVFSIKDESQDDFKSSGFKDSEKALSLMVNDFVQSHKLMQRILWNSLSHSYIITDTVRSILSNINLFSHLQWEIMLTATASSKGRDDILRTQAFWIISHLNTLHEVVEKGLVKIATHIEGRKHERQTLLEALTINKTEADPSFLAYNILMQRSSSLTGPSEVELAHFAISERTDIPDIAKERAKNILQKQTTLTVSAEEVLIQALSSLSPPDKILNTIEYILYKKELSPSIQKTLLKIKSDKNAPSKIRRFVHRIFLHTPHVRPKIAKKLGVLFWCQKGFAH